MKPMRKILFTFLLFVSFITMSNAQFNFGAGAQLVLEGTGFGLQGKALTEINETWRGAGAFTIYLTDGPNWAIDLDAQYKLLEVSDNFNFAPLAGLSIISSPSVTVLNVTAGGTDIGINLGAFFDFVPSDSYHIYVEPKFVIGAGDFIAISGGILF